MISFEVLARDQDARAGMLRTPHGLIFTPCFVPVGTYGAVNALTPEDLHGAGSQMIIANTYHLHLQPGEDLVESMGGLHRFMSWSGPLMTDSGGFQVFSLGSSKLHGVGKIASIFPEHRLEGSGNARPDRRSLVRVEEDAVYFVSYLDGSLHRFTPEKVIEIERKLGADIALVLDECTSPLDSFDYTRNAMQRTHRWAVRALEEYKIHSLDNQALLGIVQGGAYRELRMESAAFMACREFDGYAIGGSLGKSKEDMLKILEWTLPALPFPKIRHLLGIGEVQDIFEVVSRGIDLVDCVLPTRLARTGTLLTRGGKRFRIHIMNARFRNDPRSVEDECDCYTCRNYSRAYLRHLFTIDRISAVRLATIHNLFFLENLMSLIRSAVREGRFAKFRKRWLSSL